MVKEFRILCIDDDQMILNLYQSILMKFSTENHQCKSEDTKKLQYTFNLTCKLSGDEGCAAVLEAFEQQKPFSVAFIDMQMPPGIDGITTASEIRKIDPDIEIVIVTGKNIVNLDLLNKNVVPLHKLLFIKKPFQIQEIQQTVLSLSEKWVALRQNRRLINELEKAVDVTSQELSDTKNSYREIFNNATEIIQSVSTEGDILLANPAWSRLLGYPNSQIRKKSLFDIVDPEQRDKLREKLKQVHSGAIINNIETVFITKTNQKVFVKGSIVPTYHDGVIDGFSTFFRDITARKKVEDALTLTTENLKNMFPIIIQVLASTVELRDQYTAGHQERVAKISKIIAHEMGLSKQRTEGLYIAAQLHDIGKISIPTEILTKPGKLQDEEFQLIKNHVQVGYDLLKRINFPWPVADYLMQHHERVDGSGYPNGLKQDEILLEARILMVADVVEAISTHRPYRPGLGLEKAMDEIRENRGRAFDEDVVDACLRGYQKNLLLIVDTSSTSSLHSSPILNMV